MLFHLKYCGIWIKGEYKDHLYFFFNSQCKSSDCIYKQVELSRLSVFIMQNIWNSCNTTTIRKSKYAIVSAQQLKSSQQLLNKVAKTSQTSWLPTWVSERKNKRVNFQFWGNMNPAEESPRLKLNIRRRRNNAKEQNESRDARFSLGTHTRWGHAHQHTMRPRGGRLFTCAIALTSKDSKAQKQY